jgi:glycosyltransferase involved in cell wall biosynthesis
VKLGVITTSYPRFEGDPAGNFVAGHVEALRALGHRVDVIAGGSRLPWRAADGTRWIASELFDRGGVPDLIERSPMRGTLVGAAFTARLAVAIAARAHDWDSIIAHWLPSAIAALPSRVPLLAIAHGGDVHTLRRMHLLAPTLHALHLRGARIAFVSEQLRAIARGAAPGLSRWLDDAIVQPMGVSIDRFHAIALDRADPTLVASGSSRPTIVIASRLVPLKGIDVAIEAMAHVRGEARLVIAGDGPERARLDLATRSRDAGSHAAGSRDRITFLGEVGATRRDQLLRDASVVVVPSRVMPSGRTEGTPMIALEALAAGVPVVASAVGGLRELAAVRLVTPDDPHALAAAIDRTLASPPPPDQLHAAVAHLDWSRVARRLS